jgi:hypothetical protein
MVDRTRYHNRLLTNFLLHDENISCRTTEYKLLHNIKMYSHTLQNSQYCSTNSKLRSISHFTNYHLQLLVNH